MLQEYRNKSHIRGLILTIPQIQHIPLSLGLVWDHTFNSLLDLLEVVETIARQYTCLLPQSRQRVTGRISLKFSS